MKLHFQVTGSGKVPLICIHGWACHGGQFLELSRLLGKDFRIFLLDLPGHGRTPLDEFLPGFESYAGEIIDFVLMHRLERPILLGHSMGGMLSLIAAASGRLQSRAVINLDGGLPAAEKTLAGQRMIRGWLDAPDFRGRFAGLLREVFFEPPERDARCDDILRTMCAAPDPVLRFFPEQVGGLQPEKILPRVSAPVLFIGPAAPRFDSGRAAALIPHLRVERIPDAGHFLHVYVPDKVAAIVGDFLRSRSIAD